MSRKALTFHLFGDRSGRRASPGLGRPWSGWSDRGGAAGVEFALLLPTLVLFVVGMVDLGVLTYEQGQVTQAAQAGATYALRYGWNQSQITSAVTGATSLTVTATPAPSETVNACIVGGVITVVTGSTCTGGGTPGTYVQVNASASVSPLIVWSAIVMPSTLTAQAVVRIS